MQSNRGDSPKTKKTKERGNKESEERAQDKANATRTAPPFFPNHQKALDSSGQFLTYAAMPSLLYVMTNFMMCISADHASWSTSHKLLYDLRCKKGKTGKGKRRKPLYLVRGDRSIQQPADVRVEVRIAVHHAPGKAKQQGHDIAVCGVLHYQDRHSTRAGLCSLPTLLVLLAHCSFPAVDVKVWVVVHHTPGKAKPQSHDRPAHASHVARWRPAQDANGD